MNLKQLFYRVLCLLHGHVFRDVANLDDAVKLCRCDRCEWGAASYPIVSVCGVRRKHAAWTEHHDALWRAPRVDSLDAAAEHALRWRWNFAVWVRLVKPMCVGLGCTVPHHKHVWAATLVDMNGEPRSAVYYGSTQVEACRRLMWAMRS